MTTAESLTQIPDRYNCEVGQQHFQGMVHPAAEFTDGTSDIPWVSTQVRNQYAMQEEGSIEALSIWAENHCLVMPSRIEPAYSINEYGRTSLAVETRNSTRWVPLGVEDGDIYGRFSQSVTALHGDRALRTPVDGVAFEVTTRPESFDIRDAIALVVVRNVLSVPKTGFSAHRFRRLRAEVYDLISDSLETQQPASAVPAGSVYPNRLRSFERQQEIQQLGALMLSQLKEPVKR